MSASSEFCFLTRLAGAFLTAEWTAEALRAIFRQVTVTQPLRVPGLARRILERFPVRPEYSTLVVFLCGDSGVRRALDRASGRPLSRRRPFRSRPRPPVMGPPPARLAAVPLPPLATAQALADWLGVSAGRLLWFADPAGRNRHHPPGPLRTYRHRWVPKPRGRARLLEIPAAGLKAAQRKILAGILDVVPAHPAAHGFCRGRSIVTNAERHCGKQVVLRFDLADFFPSVPAARVFRLFRTLGYPDAPARLLTGLCTTRLPRDVWDGRPHPPADGSDHPTWQRFAARHLPQGAPTSPALANLAAHRLDRRLTRLAALAGADYTRYADDLTFSGDGEFARRTRRFAAAVARIAGDEGFALNFRKTRLMRQAARQHVGGIVVNVRPNVPRAAFDQIKAVLTNCARHGPHTQNRDGRPDFRACLAGRVAHVAAVNPARGRKLWALFDRIAWGGS